MAGPMFAEASWLDEADFASSLGSAFG